MYSVLYMQLRRKGPMQEGPLQRLDWEFVISLQIITIVVALQCMYKCKVYKIMYTYVEWSVKGAMVVQPMHVEVPFRNLK